MQNPAEQIARQRSGKLARDAALLLLTGVALSLCWLLARPFLSAITWALALGVVAHPLHSRLERWLRPNPAALLALLAVVVVLLAPGAVLLQKILDEAGGGLGVLAQNLHSGQLREAAGRFPLIAKALQWFEATFDLNEELKRAAGTVAGRASAVLGRSIQVVTQIAVMLVTLFYFLRDRDKLLQFLRQLIPLSAEEADDLFGRVSATIYATLHGNVVVKLDNLLYPMLVAGELRFHTLGIFFSVFGALIAFGPAGVVLGPVILASTVALMEVWRLRGKSGPENAA